MKLLNFNPVQQRMLQEIQTKLVNSFLNGDFKDPENDQKEIRRQAYMKGKLELVTEFLVDDWPDTAETLPENPDD
jgi:hypothetical protein